MAVCTGAPGWCDGLLEFIGIGVESGEKNWTESGERRLAMSGICRLELMNAVGNVRGHLSDKKARLTTRQIALAGIRGG